MVEMAKRGSGNHYYGDTAADLFEPFAEEFDFISALCARHVRLSLAAGPGVSIRLLNDYPVDGDAGIPVPNQYRKSLMAPASSILSYEWVTMSSKATA